MQYEIEYEDGEKEELKFIIITNNKMLDNLKNNLIEEYFIDATYSCVSLNIHKFKLIVLIGYDIENISINICCFILIMNEKYETFENIF